MWAKENTYFNFFFIFYEMKYSRQQKIGLYFNEKLCILNPTSRIWKSRRRFTEENIAKFCRTLFSSCNYNERLTKNRDPFIFLHFPSTISSSTPDCLLVLLYWGDWVEWLANEAIGWLIQFYFPFLPEHYLTFFFNWERKVHSMRRK
jgi:hypothetical protein